MSVLTAALAAGCASAPTSQTTISGSPAPSAAADVKAASPMAPQKGVVTGVALAPKGIVAAVIPVGAGNVIPVGAGNVIPVGAGNMQLMALAQSPLANAEVFLADAGGQPIPSLPSVKTDAEGKFTFQDVPADYTLLVVARAHDNNRDKDVTLQTLVRTSGLGATAPIDAASSMVTTAVTANAGSQLGQLNPATFQAAAQATADHVTDADLPDLSDRNAVLAKVAALSASIAELKTELDEIEQDLKDIKDTVHQIQTDIESQSRPSPPPGGPMQVKEGDPGPQGCGVVTKFTLDLQGSWTGYPLTVHYVGLGNPDKPVIARGTVASPGATFTVLLPASCPHIVELYDSDGKLLASKDHDELIPGDPTSKHLSF